MKTKIALSQLIALLFIMASCSADEQIMQDMPSVLPETEKEMFDFPRSETFTFSSGGKDVNGIIYFPDSYETNRDLPAIYLLDYQEQHFEVTKDETEQVIRGIQALSDFDALVVTLAEHLYVDAKANEFQDHYSVFKDMTSYVDTNYTDNTSRTFIAKGSEAGVVLLSLLSEDQASSVFNNFIATDSPSSFNNVVIEMIRNNKVPGDLKDKKLHFSFSISNNRDNCLALISAFEKAQYPWLMFESKEYTATNFNNTYPISFAAGLKFVFNR